MQKTVGKAQGIALLILSNVIWGLSFIFSKTALSEGIPPMTLAFLRYVIAALVLTPICLKQEGSIRLRKWAPLGLVSTLLGITVYYFFEYTGLKYTTASAASLILALVPMMTLLYRVIAKQEKISLIRWACVILSLVGVYFVIQADSSEGAGSLIGNLLMVCACLCWTGYILATPRLMQACSSTRVTTWQAIAALVTLAPLALMERSQWVMPSPKALFCLFMLAVFASAICYVIYGVAIRSVDSLTVSLSININPIVACVAGAVMLGEMLTASQMLGGVMIMIAVLADSLEEGGFLTKKQA